MAHILKDSIYTTDLKAERHSQSLYTNVKLPFSTSWEVDQAGGSSAILGGVQGEEAEGNFCYGFGFHALRCYHIVWNVFNTGGGSSDGTAMDNLFVHAPDCHRPNCHR